MKKNYIKIKLCVALLSLMVTWINAQINGIVTINSGLPTGGTNYQSWNDLATVLNGPGVNGALTVNIQTGTSYTEQVIFNQITGASATNSIVINGNNTVIMKTGSNNSSTGHTIRLSGTDFMTINDLVVLGLGASYAWPLTLCNGADNNSFNNCTFSVQINQTSTNFIPVMCSGNGTSYSSTGDFGDNNVWTSCTTSGGAHGVSFYGSTASPFASGNKLIDCHITDFYGNGIYNTYATDSEFRNNTIERLTRTNSTTAVGIYLNTGSLRAIAEGNWIRRLFDNMLTSTSACYGIRSSSAPGAGNEIQLINNLIADVRHNGEMRGIYVSVANHLMYHNTISIDDPSSTSGSATYGLMTAATSTVLNNIITIGRGGTGTKYAAYISSTVGVVWNYNVIDITSVAGSNNYGYNGSAVSTYTAWRAANGGAWDQQGLNVDPMFTTLGSNYTPLNIQINNAGFPVGVATDMSGQARSNSTPDPGAIEIFNIPCSGPPMVLAVDSPTNAFCAGTPVYISLPVSSYSFSGYTYQWQSSTVTPLGPFTAIPGATMATLQTPSVANVTTWYSVVVACPNQGTTTSVSGVVNMVLTVTTTVPYSESFESLEPQRMLPNCSWLVTSSVALSQTVTNTAGRVPRTGSNFAMFTNATPGTNAFYTNGIWMDAGITYSASVWYRTDGIGSVNWTDLTMLVGPNQSATGQSTIVSTGGPAVAPVHDVLTNTFTVPSSGLYYVALRATSTSGGSAYLTFDDLMIEMPCALNIPSLSTSVISNTVCSGHAVTIFGSGADTYTWSTGENAAVITVTPQGGSNMASYTLYGTKALSGCVASLSQTLNVYPSPVVSALVYPTEVCSGSTANLLASGNAISYNWSNGVNQAAAMVNPTSNTTYSVYGINAYGCDNMATVQVSVNTLPNISVGANPTQICEGEPVTFNASGAQTYSWVSNTSIVYLGNPVTLNPMSSSVFTVIGVDAKGCANKAMYTLVVEACTGLKALGKETALVKVAPNPSQGIFSIETNTNSEKIIELSDMTGRIILSGVIRDEKAEMNINGFAAGVYYLKVRSGSATEVIKIVKNN